jgi:hypothetical protein
MSNTYSVITIGYKSLNNIINRVNECYNGPNPPNEFILIINYYSEESYKILEYVKNESRITRYVFCSQNIGFAKAINLGYKLSNSENLIILNDDCQINQNTCYRLSEMLVNNFGISTILLGGKSGDLCPMPQGFILGIKKIIVDGIGGYIYDEIASPLGCERELTYRVKVLGYDLAWDSNLYFKHVHDISNHPTTIINYLGNNISPRGENSFQDYTESKLDEKINKHKNNIINGKNSN